MKFEITDWNPAKAKVLLGRRDITKTNVISAVHFRIIAGDEGGSRAEIHLHHLPFKADVKILKILDDELKIPAILW